MGNFFSELMKKDLDDIFSYKTPKVVKVRDRRLGIIKVKTKIFFFFLI